MSRNGGYSRIDVDAVAPLLPGDRVAGRVASRGEHFEWQCKDRKVHSPEPIPYRRPNRIESITPSFTDLTGLKFGRLTVLGIAADIPSNGTGQRWVVRCVCGAHETRKARSIKAATSGERQEDSAFMCAWCDNNQRLQKGFGNRKKAEAAAQAIKEAAK